MAQTSVAQLAADLKMPSDALLDQLNKAGVAKSAADDLLSEQDKSRLLEYLRRSHGEAEAKTKITLTRKETSEIRAQDSHGKSRTVQVEVRKKRVLVKRDAPEVPSVEPLTVAPVAPLETAPPVVEPVVAAPVVEPVEPVVESKPVVEEVVPAKESAPEPVIATVDSKAVESTEAVGKEKTKEKSQEKAPEKGKASEKVGDKPGEKAKARPVAEEVADAEGAVKAPVKKVVTRASIIGEEQQRLRAEEERRKAELRARQEAEFLEKQQRVADLARLKIEAHPINSSDFKVTFAVDLGCMHGSGCHRCCWRSEFLCCFFYRCTQTGFLIWTGIAMHHTHFHSLIDLAEGSAQ